MYYDAAATAYVSKGIDVWVRLVGFRGRVT
jgi:hypothetical protein